MVRPAKGGLMEKPYTHTTWRVRAGSEDEFVRRWSEWVDWSHREGLEAPALLLRDLENPQAFISFGPWANMAAVRSWRALAGWNGWHGSARYSTASSHERSRSSHGAKHRGQGNQIAVQPHRYRETSKRRPAGRPRGRCRLSAKVRQLRTSTRAEGTTACRGRRSAERVGLGGGSAGSGDLSDARSLGR